MGWTQNLGFQFTLFQPGGGQIIPTAHSNVDKLESPHEIMGKQVNPTPSNSTTVLQYLGIWNTFYLLCKPTYYVHIVHK